MRILRGSCSARRKSCFDFQQEHAAAFNTNPLRLALNSVHATHGGCNCVGHSDPICNTVFCHKLRPVCCSHYHVLESAFPATRGFAFESLAAYWCGVTGLGAQMPWEDHDQYERHKFLKAVIATATKVDQSTGDVRTRKVCGPFTYKCWCKYACFQSPTPSLRSYPLC